jgi:hypothetical protein
MCKAIFEPKLIPLVVICPLRSGFRIRYFHVNNLKRMFLNTNSLLSNCRLCLQQLYIIWQLTLSLSSPRDLLIAAGWLRKTDTERILSIRSLRCDSVDEISQGDTDTESLTRMFFHA